MLRTVAISSLLLVGAISMAEADVFRWVDEHGGVHYSDQWVPGSQVIKSSTSRPTSGAPLVAEKRTSDSLKSASASPSPDPAATKAMKQDLTKMRDQQCKEAKEKYDKAIEARRIYKSSGEKKDVDGNEERQYLSDEEADAYRVKLRQTMQDLCGNSSR